MTNEATKIAYDFISLYKKIDSFIFATKFTLDFDNYKSNDFFINMRLWQADLEDYYNYMQEDFINGNVEKNAWSYNFENIADYIENQTKAFREFRFYIYKERMNELD